MAGGWRRTRQDTAVWADARAPASASVSCACSGGSAPPSSSHCKADEGVKAPPGELLQACWHARSSWYTCKASQSTK
jgi:hypothetical protein